MTRFCLWGGSEEWVQIGSARDQRLQIELRFKANIERVGRALLTAIGDPLRQMADAVSRVSAELYGPDGPFPPDDMAVGVTMSEEHGAIMLQLRRDVEELYDE